jgi:hypothetical protein
VAGTLVVEVREALVDLLTARPNLEGKQVSYGWPGDDVLETESIFTASRARIEQEPSSLKAGRTFRDETVDFDVVIRFEAIGGTALDADQGAQALGTEVEECVADNRTLGVAGVQWVTIRPVALVGLYNDNGHLAELTYTIRYRARLT